MTTKYLIGLDKFAVIDASTGQEIESFPYFDTYKEAKAACGDFEFTDDVTHFYYGQWEA